jgi:hypothetical protein
MLTKKLIKTEKISAVSSGEPYHVECNLVACKTVDFDLRTEHTFSCFPTINL